MPEKCLTYLEKGLKLSVTRLLVTLTAIYTVFRVYSCSHFSFFTAIIYNLHNYLTVRFMVSENGKVHINIFSF